MMRLLLALGSFVLLALSLPLAAGPTARSEGSWERLGFAGANVQSIALDASRPNTLLVVTQTGYGYTGYDYRVYRSGDRGLTWNELTGLSGAVQVVSAGRGVYYAAGAGIYRSGDGVSWTRVYTATQPSEAVIAVRVSRGNPQVAYALSRVGGWDDGLLRTGDGGNMWVPRNVPPDHLTDLSRLDIDAGRDDWVYAVGGYCGYTGLWVSKDGGLRWEGDGFGYGLGTGYLVEVKSDATLSGTFYAAVDCLYRLSNGVQTILSPTQDGRCKYDARGLHGLASSRAVGGGLFAAVGQDKVEWSVDRGDHWASLGAPAGYIGTLEVDDENPLSLYVGTTDGLWRTRLPRYYFPRVVKEWASGW